VGTRRRGDGGEQVCEGVSPRSVIAYQERSTSKCVKSAAMEDQTHMNRQAEHGHENPVQHDEPFTDQVGEAAKKYASKARDIGEDAIDRADEYLRPVGLSLKERPMATLAVFGGIAFVAGAFWMLRNSRQQSRLHDVLPQLNDFTRRSRSWW
jgi:hypothetical protein